MVLNLQREYNPPHYTPDNVKVNVLPNGQSEVCLTHGDMTVVRFWLPPDVAHTLEDMLRAHRSGL